MFSTRVLQEGLNGVKATSDKGQKILLTANRQRLKILTDNRQSNETLTVMRNSPPPPFQTLLERSLGKYITKLILTLNLLSSQRGKYLHPFARSLRGITLTEKYQGYLAPVDQLTDCVSEIVA